jgi:hypothetical protein
MPTPKLELPEDLSRFNPLVGKVLKLLLFTRMDPAIADAEARPRRANTAAVKRNVDVLIDALRIGLGSGRFPEKALGHP